MIKDCFANYDETTGTVSIGNNLVEKTMRIKGSFICTEKVIDRKNNKEWSGGPSLWQRCPVLGTEETPKITFEVSDIYNELGMLPHIKAVITFSGNEGTAWFEYIVFPDIPFVFNQIFVEKHGRIESCLDQGDTFVCNGIEPRVFKNTVTDLYCSDDTLDCVPLGNNHLEVESFNLFDKTDKNDSLVERTVTPVYKYRICRTEKVGNLFRISDYPHGLSMLLIKHSPTHSSALNRKGNDLVIQGNIYASLIGNGIDFSSLPEGKVPYYASAIGVAKTADIFDELWRYNTAFATGDPRKSLFIMSNTWGDRNHDMAICEDFILKEIERAKELGVDIVQIDDGWENGITANSLRKTGGAFEGFYKNDNDFWTVNTERFPNGLEPVVKKARESGSEIALWFNPDSSNDLANVEKDIETIYGLYSKYDVHYFKLDGVAIRSKVGEMRFIHLLDELTKRSNGEIRFNLDVTASNRFGYVYEPRFGTLFVENRYTDFLNYFPHNTFKNLWNLASVVPTRRLQMELLNIRRNIKAYNDIPFAPSEYNMDYVFAVVMPANPLVWMEMSHLADDDAKVLASIISAYKPHAKEIFDSQVIPIGNAPNGMNFSGYFCRNADKKSGHLILFRESTEESSFTFNIPTDTTGMSSEVIYQSAPATVVLDGKNVKVDFKDQRSFIWIEIK